MVDDNGDSLKEQILRFNPADIIPDERTQNTNEDESEDIEQIAISFEEARRVIDKQFEAHYKNQDSTFRLFRSIVAITAVAVTLFSAVFSRTIPVGIDIPPFNENINTAIQNISTTIGFAGIFSFNLPSGFPEIFVGLSLAIFSIITFAFVTIGGTAIFGGILTTLLILSPPLLKPIHDGRELKKISDHEEVKDSLGETYKSWISANNKPLQISNERLGNVYQQMLTGFIFLGLATVYATITYFSAISFGIFVTVVGFNLGVLYDLLSPQAEEHEDFAMMLNIEQIASMNLRKKAVFLTTSSIGVILVGFTMLLY